MADFSSSFFMSKKARRKKEESDRQAAQQELHAAQAQFQMRLAAEQHKERMRANAERAKRDARAAELREEEAERKRIDWEHKMADRQVKLGQTREKAASATGDKNLKRFDEMLFTEFGSVNSKGKEVLPLEIRKQTAALRDQAREDPALTAHTFIANKRAEEKIKSDWQKAGLPAAVEERKKVLGVKELPTDEYNKLASLTPQAARQLMGEMGQRQFEARRITPEVQARWDKENAAVKAALKEQKPLEKEFAALTARTDLTPEQYQSEFSKLRSQLKGTQTANLEPAPMWGVEAMSTTAPPTDRELAGVTPAAKPPAATPSPYAPTDLQSAIRAGEAGRQALAAQPRETSLIEQAGSSAMDMARQMTSTPYQSGRSPAVGALVPATTTPNPNPFLGLAEQVRQALTVPMESKRTELVQKGAQWRGMEAAPIQQADLNDTPWRDRDVD